MAATRKELGLHGHWSLVLTNILWTIVGHHVMANSPVLNDHGDVHEYCQLEEFKAECPENNVIVITSGSYGRMRLGRCMRQAYGSLGCSTNVLQEMDKLCSGQASCSFEVSTLHENRHPCPTDLTPFLEAGYYCQSVIPGSPQRCSASAGTAIQTDPSGYISNHITMETGRGSDGCPWRIEVPLGQRINVTLVNFARVSFGDPGESQGINAVTKCYQYAVFDEGVQKQTFTQCEGGHRLVHAYTSTTNTLDITILPKKETEIYFMLYYEAFGCPNPILAPTLWIQRTDDTATVKCNSTGESWNLKCIGRDWQGTIGNCTAPGNRGWEGSLFEGDGFPYSILIVVAIGVALGVFLGGILLVCASKYFKRRRDGNLRNEHFQQSLYGVEHGKILASQFDDVGGGTPRTLHYHGMRFEDAHIPTIEKECKCPYSSYGPPPSHASSHMYESPQFDRKDSR